MSGKDLNCRSYGFTENFNSRVEEVLAFYSPHFQTCFLDRISEFDIHLYCEAFELSAPELILELPDEAVERLFIQFYDIAQFIIKQRIRFIDLSRFAIHQDDDNVLVQFEIQFLRDCPIHQNDQLVSLFRKNSLFGDLDRLNIFERYKQLMKRYPRRDQQFILKYSDLNASFLCHYQLDEITRNGNTMIRVSSGGKSRRSAIRQYLMAHLYDEHCAVYVIENGFSGFIEATAEIGSFHLDPKSDLVEQIETMERALLNGSVKSLIFLVSRSLTSFEHRFLAYLMKIRKRNPILLLVFDADIHIETDLVFNENPENYCHIDPRTDSNQEIVVEADQLNGGGQAGAGEQRSIYLQRLHSLLNGGDWKVIWMILKEFDPVERDVSESIEMATLLGKYFEQFGQHRHYRVFLIDLFLSLEMLESAEQILEEHCRQDVFYPLKMGRIYLTRRDFQKLRQVLEQVSSTATDIEDYRAEYHFLQFSLLEKYGKKDEWQKHLEQISEDFFRHQANIQLSDRLLNRAEFSDAFRILQEGRDYFLNAANWLEALRTDAQLAKYHRESGYPSRAEALYKTTFFQSDLHGFCLLSASLALDLGNLYYHLDQFGRSRHWYLKSRSFYRASGNQNGEQICDFNLGEIYKYSGDWLKAEQVFEAALERDRSASREESVGIDCYNIAHLAYLRDQREKSQLYCTQAVDSFIRCGKMSGIIDGLLFQFRICFKSLEQSDLDDFKTRYLDKCNQVQEGIFRLIQELHLLKPEQTGRRSREKRLLKTIAVIDSKRIQMELLIFCISQLNSEHLMEQLKREVESLHPTRRAYFFYEYYYLYFSHFLSPGPIEDENKSLFLEIYYFFLKNGRLLNRQIQELKKRFERENSIDALLEDAKTVERFKNWSSPEDFFNCFSAELQQKSGSHLIVLAIYSGQERRFRFSSMQDFQEISEEMIETAIQSAQPLNLRLSDIRQMENREKILYPFSNTRILFWKMGERFHGVLLLGFSDDRKIDVDIMQEYGGILRKYADLFTDFYHNQYINRDRINFIIGESAVIESVKRKIAKVSRSDFPVLVTGESGTGKELIAKAIHQLSYRSDKPFVPVNIASIPETLLESELFGAKKGAFTGANESRIGLIESAAQGTLFLDEIGEVPLQVQAKLLRTLESGELRRLGENQRRLIDVRVIYATNRNLEEMVRDGIFRADLLYRIGGLEITAPPLRERTGDIPLLVRHFLRKYRFDLDDENAVQGIINYLLNQAYPGNIRELESRVKHVITFYPDYNQDETEGVKTAENIGLIAQRDRFEKQLIETSLRNHRFRIQDTAASLGISRVHLSNLIKKYRIATVN